MVVGKQRGADARNGVVSGSIWESRMKIDQVKGGIKVFTGDEISDDINGEKKKLTRPPKLTVVATSPTTKRKTWKSENSDANPIQIANQNLDEHCKEITHVSELGKEQIVSLVDGIEKTPIRRIKSRFEETTKERDSPAGSKIPPIQIRKGAGESGDQGIEKINLMQLRKVKSEINNGSIEFEPDRSSSLLDIGILMIKDNEFEKKKKPNPKQVTMEQTAMEIDDDDDDDEEEKGVSTDEKKEEIIEEKEIIIGGIEEKSKQIMKQIQERPAAPIVKKQSPPVTVRIQTNPSSSKTKFTRVPQSRHNRLQSLVDLVMWNDVSKSAFVFGFGTFIIVSSSYTTDVNISLISVVSYLGLLYLAVIFLSRSIIRRGNEVADQDQDHDHDIDNDDGKNYVIGEEEAMWLMRKVLPYLNEFLLKLRALFSGDPATTMKLAVMLYILARCGSSITIWKLIKFGFIGIFTVPKICSSYSTHFTAYGNFWFRRFRDAWDSCSHKKAVAIATFILIWNLSSIVARFWALFMLFVAFRYYKESGMMMNKDEEDDDAVQREATTWQAPIGNSSGRRVRSTLIHTTTTLPKKEKKRY